MRLVGRSRANLGPQSAAMHRGRLASCRGEAGFGGTVAKGPAKRAGQRQVAEMIDCSPITSY